MNVNIPSHNPEQKNDTNINQLVSSIMANPRLSDSNREEVLEVLKKYNLEKLNTQKNTVVELLNLKIGVESKLRVNKLITRYRKNPKLHTKEINSLFNSTIIVKKPTTLKEMDTFEEAMNNVLNPKQIVKEEKKPIKPISKIQTPYKNQDIKNNTDFEKLDKKDNSRDEVLFNMVDTYLVYEGLEKHHIEKDDNGWETEVDIAGDNSGTKTELKNARALNKYLDETGKKELDVLLKLTRDLDIDEGEIGIVGKEPILEIDTTGSNVILSIDNNGLVHFSGQKNGELFTQTINYEELLEGKKELKAKIDNYDKKSRNQLIEDAIGIGTVTLSSSLVFLLKTGLSLMVSGLGFAFAIQKGIDMYNKNNLDRNKSLRFAKELKENKSYEEYKKILKPYIYGIDIGYIESYSESDGKYTFTTVDGTKIAGEDLEQSMEKYLWKNEGKDGRIENKEISNKYRILKALKQSTIDFDYMSEGKYDLDFTGLGDDTSLSFEGQKVILKTDEIEGTFEYNILDKGIIQKILLVDKYLQEVQYLDQLERTKESNIIGIIPGQQSKIDEQKEKIANIKNIISKNNILQNNENQEKINKKTTTTNNINIDFIDNTKAKLGKQNIKATRYFESNNNTEHYDVTLVQEGNKYILEIDDWGGDSTIEFKEIPTNGDIKKAINKYNLGDSEAEKIGWDV